MPPRVEREARCLRCGLCSLGRFALVAQQRRLWVLVVGVVKLFVVVVGVRVARTVCGWGPVGNCAERVYCLRLTVFEC